MPSNGCGYRDERSYGRGDPITGATLEQLMAVVMSLGARSDSARRHGPGLAADRDGPTA